VHACGTARIIDDLAAVRNLLDDLIANSDTYGWTMPWQDDRSSGLLAAIVAFEIDIERLEGKAKLGQNRSMADQQGTSQALNSSARAGDRELARFIEGYQPERSAE